jgi:uncharacterized protein YwgA
VKEVELASFLKEYFTHQPQIFGQKAFQKLLYLAQARGLRTDFDFRLHLFGPFSDQAASSLEVLTEGGAVRSEFGGALRPGTHLDEVAHNFELNPDDRAAVEWTSQEFGANTPLELELIATVLFMVQAEQRVLGPVTEESILRKVSRYKGPKFTEQQIRQAFERLAEHNLTQRHAGLQFS